MQRLYRRWKIHWLWFVALFGISVGIATAYFTARSLLDGTVLGVASADIQIDQVLPEAFQALVPGEPQEFLWKISNLSTIPIVASARFLGAWDNDQLESQLVRLKNLRFKLNDAQTWQSLDQLELTPGAEVFISPTGSDEDLVALAAGDELQLAGEVELADSADNSYQDAQFPFSVQVRAKQVTDGATWPAYDSAE
ncbi:hypothetical protein KC921_00920 [Candidatus Woesebacteria bacterium]|nr:hypothetical protein [Candidatus Woesebacteria bacterium]